MARVEVYRRGDDGRARHIATIQRLVWSTHPGFAHDSVGVSGVWSKHTQHWCRFDGERRLLTRDGGSWKLVISAAQVPSKQVMF